MWCEFNHYVTFALPDVSQPTSVQGLNEVICPLLDIRSRGGSTDGVYLNSISPIQAQGNDLLTVSVHHASTMSCISISISKHRIGAFL